MSRKNFRWIIVGLLFFITITNYVDRAAISYAIDDIQKLFHLDDGQVGLILGGFGLGYAITTFLGGIAVDRYGPKVILGFSVLLWSLALLGTGFATGFAMVMVARIVLGVAEGPNFPAMTRAVGDWLPEEERARALSFGLMAVPIALAIGGPIVTELMSLFSWRIMFIVLGAVGVLWLPVWWLLFKNFPKDSKHISEQELLYIDEGHIAIDSAAVMQERKQVKGLWRYLFTNPTLLANYWAFFVFGYFLFFFMGWLPSYLSDQYHIKLKEIGLFTVLPWTLAAVMMWFVGKWSDRSFKITKSLRQSRTRFIILSQLLAALCVIPIVYVANVNEAMIFISLAVGFSMSANSSFYAVNIDIAKERAGTALGIMDAAFAIAGFVAPALTGWIVQETGHFKAAFLLMAVLALSSVLITFFFHQPDKAKQLI